MLNLSKCQFVKSAAQKKDFLLNKKQVVFLGRSNVGKSSLINALVNNKKMVYVSKTPGRTKLISYFMIDDEKAYLVDAPGYGFFKDGALDFEKMMLDYLNLGPSLVKRAYVLLDSRREISDNDFNVVELVERYGIKVCFIFTKADKLNMSEKAKLTNLIAKHFPDDKVIITSSEKKLGLDEVKKDITLAISEK